MTFYLGLYFVFFVGGISFLLFYRFHYFMVLLGIEIIMLSLFYMFSSVGLWSISMGSLIVFLVMMVIEGAFGLCVLVSYIIMFGGDYFVYSSGFWVL